jgi:hypothetical protein
MDDDWEEMPLLEQEQKEGTPALPIDTPHQKRIAILRDKYLSTLTSNPDSIAFIFQMHHPPTTEAFKNVFDDEFLHKIHSSYTELTNEELTNIVEKNPSILSSVGYFFLNNTHKTREKFKCLFMRMWQLWFQKSLERMIKYYY